MNLLTVLCFIMYIVTCTMLSITLVLSNEFYDNFTPVDDKIGDGPYYFEGVPIDKETAMKIQRGEF